MELPAALRAAAERELDGVSLADLQRAADALSARYRGAVRDGRLHLSGELAALAYLATRLPATYAAVRDSLDRVAQAHPDFAPRSLLDIGAGPGTALWAAADCWPALSAAVMVEASPFIRTLGERLAAGAGVPDVTWRHEDVLQGRSVFEPADLVTLAYALNELPEEQGLALAGRLWDATAGVLVVVEPGTPAGWRRMLAVRTLLVGRGAHVLAPCAHGQPCPVREPDWCHFSRRVARSRLHRLAKRGEVAWEDEKYVYLAVSRRPAGAPGARLLAPPKAGSGKVALKLCCADGKMREPLVLRRMGDAYRRARRADWGDVLPEEGGPQESGPE